MSEDHGSKRGKKRVQRAAKTRSRARGKGEGTLEELGPERRQELAQQIEAKRVRGKPSSI